MSKVASLTDRRELMAAQLRALADAELNTRRQIALRDAQKALENPVVNALFSGARKTLEGVDIAGREAAKTIFRPATTLGPLAAKGIRGVITRPEVMVPAISVAAAAPAILSDTRDQYHKNVEEANRMLASPGNVRIAQEVTLESFMSKTAAGRPESFGRTVGVGMSKGLGEQLGKSIIDRMLDSVTGTLSNVLSTPARKNLIKKLFESDQIISDAIKRNPQMQRQLLEAYGTMLKFAPSLTTDTNAVRSFLREVVLGGGNVNYAVIKNLIDTEKAYHR